jgi:hypothetical protein
MEMIHINGRSTNGGILAAIIGLMSLNPIGAHAGYTCRPIEAASDIPSLTVFEHSRSDKPFRITITRMEASTICALVEPQNGRLAVCYQDHQYFVLPSQVKFKSGVYSPLPPQTLPDKVHLGAVASANAPHSGGAGSPSGGWGSGQAMASRSVTLSEAESLPDPCGCKKALPDDCH